MSTSYFFTYLYWIVGCFVAYSVSMLVLQFIYTFHGRRDPKQSTSDREDENKDDLGMSQGVKMERDYAMQAVQARDGDKASVLQVDEEEEMMPRRPNFAIVVNHLECWKSLSKQDIGSHN